MLITRPSGTRIAGILMALACASAAQAQFKCVDRHKRITFQQHPCPLDDQSTVLRITSGTPSTAAESTASTNSESPKTHTLNTGSSSGRTYRGEPCPSASEMAELDSKIAKMRQKNPDIPDGTREMLLSAALKTRDDVKKACG